MPSIRIILIEDDAPFAAALSRYFALPDSGAECLAVYPTAEAALKGVRDAAPELALVDINLPGMNGIECVARLKLLCPELLCLILTTYDDQPIIFDALKAGACGYLLKRTPPAEIVTAIQQARDGGSPMSPHVARQVVSFFHSTPPLESPAGLTERERTVLGRLAQGLLYKEIADELSISLDTVRSHMRKIYEKLHVHSRHAAVQKFRDGKS